MTILNFRNILVSFFCLATVSASEIIYSSDDLFPLHDEMSTATNFWINIYAKYNNNQYLIHDSRELGIVYEVVKWGELDESKIDDPYTKQQRDFFKKKRNYYKDLLNGIAGVFPDTTKMSAEQKKVLKHLTDFKSQQDFREAARRIRVQRGQKNKFRRGLEISGRYMPFLKRIFKKYDLPEELTVLPHVESSFNYQAYSSAGAAGIWQFTRGTGKQFMKISYEIDERLDPLLATEAAAKLLKQNYQALGSWPLAITAYNHGVHGMKRAVNKLKTKDMNTIIKNYRSRYFKFASRNFYCEFIAALHVVQNYPRYFGVIAFEEPIQYKEFDLPRYLNYATLVDYLEIADGDFRKYNPALRQSVYNNSKYIPKGYRVRVPFYVNVDSILATIPQSEYIAEQKQSKYYHIRYGDTLSDIARRFGTSVDVLLALNNLSNAHFITRGMTLRLPDKSVPPTVTVAVKEKPLPKPQPEVLPQTGDTLILAMADVKEDAVPALLWQYEIPVEYRAEPQTVAIKVPIIDESDMEIEFSKTEDPAIGYIKVEPEETLGHYSDWLQIKTQRVREWNNLSFYSSIQLDQKIKLVFDKVTPEEFNRLRLEYHSGLEEDFFLNYEIVDTLTHQVKSGDNLWYLSNHVYNLPYWLIVDFNKEVDFANLKPGDNIVIPSIKSKG